DFFEQVLVTPPANGTYTRAVLESLARVHLVRGRPDLCRAVLATIDSDARTEHDRRSYEHRHAAHTRIQLLATTGQVDLALSETENLLEVATRAGDALL